MINNSGQNIDLLYNQKNLVFNTVVGETFSDINFDNTRFYKGWTNIRYWLTDNTFSLCLNEKPYKTVAIALKDKCFKILFGANDLYAFFSTDVLPMIVRNVFIREDGKQKFYWPLNNSSEQQIVKKLRRNLFLL